MDRPDDLTTALLHGRIGRREFLKRATALGLSVPAAGALLAACGGDDEGPAAETGGDRDFEGIKLKFAKAPHGEDERQKMAELLQPFKDETGVEIEHTIVPWDQLEATYTANFAGSDPFDVTYQVSTHLTLFGDRGAFEDMWPYVNADDFSDDKGHIPQGIFDASNYRDKLYGVPFIIGTIVMFSNDDMLEQAGLQVPETTDQLVEVAKALKSDDVWGFYTPTTVKDFGWYFNLQNIHNFGGDIISDDFSAATIDSEPVVRATRYATDLIQTHKVQPPVGAYDREGGIELFKAGKLALLLDEPLRVTPFKEEGLPFAWDIHMPVGSPDGTRTTFSTTGHWVMAAKSKNKDAAWELIRFLSAVDFSTKYNEHYGFVPVRDDADVSGGDELLAKNLEFAQCCWDGLKTHPKMSQILDEYVKALEAASSGSTSVENALGDAQSKATEILQRG